MDIQGLREYVKSCIARSGKDGRGAQAEIARKCGVSESALSSFMSDNYAGSMENVAVKIATALNYYENGWSVVTTVTSYQQVKVAFSVAKKESKWVCISSRSGSGKTQSLIDLYNTSKDNSVIYLKCRKWSARKFLTRLATAFGAVINRYQDNDELLDVIIKHANLLSAKKPILIIDDAGKLSNSAMQTFIPLYDDTFRRMGCIVAGTETLERTIKRNIGRVEGYDEIDSRFNRNYITLMGAGKKDVVSICMANGVELKEDAEQIWGKLEKFKKEVPGQAREVLFADDLRELSGMIDNAIYQQKVAKGEIEL